MFSLETLVRKNVAALQPYTSARDEFSGEAEVYLDANENPVDTGLNRYPDPYQSTLKNTLAAQRNLATNQIFIGNGSDEAIDLLIRAFCEPQQDTVMVLPPTYGMYQVSAAINAVQVEEVPLTEEFQPDFAAILEKVTSKTKLLFLCSPNNPTGNLMDPEKVVEVLNAFPGVVIIDEAYMQFASAESWCARLREFPNLVVLQTLSKAYGLASIRLGMAFAAPEVIAVLNKIKPPYNVNGWSQQKATEVLQQSGTLEETVTQILSERARLTEALQTQEIIEKIYPSEANFLLVKVANATAVYRDLAQKGIVLRDRSKMPGCESCLRITIGTKQENDQLIAAIAAYTNAL